MVNVPPQALQQIAAQSPSGRIESGSYLIVELTYRPETPGCLSTGVIITLSTPVLIKQTVTPESTYQLG